MRKLARVIFKDGLHCLGRWRVKRTIAATFSRKDIEMLVSFCAKIHTLIPKWRAEKPRLTSSPVRPLTSFEAAQSSRTMRVFVPSKAKLANFNHISIWCCSQIITYSLESLSPNRYRVLLYAKVGQFPAVPHLWS